MDKNEIIPFGYDDQLVRTVVIDGMPWFVAKDVCAALGISKYRDAIASLDEDEGCPVKVDTLGGVQEMSAVNESGLYTLIMRSNKPEAKRFRKWVTSEVLPSINRTGQYTLPQMVENRIAALEANLIGQVDAIKTALSDISEQFKTADYLRGDQLFEIQQEIDGLKGVKEVVDDLNAARKEVKVKNRYFELDEDIAEFFKNHIATDVVPMTCTKVIDLWDLFRYDYDNKYKKAEFLERFKMLYPQFTLFKQKNVYVFEGFLLFDKHGACN